MSTHDMLPLFGTSNEYQQHILKETNTYQATQLIWSYIENPHSFSLINPWILSGVFYHKSLDQSLFNSMVLVFIITMFYRSFNI